MHPRADGRTRASPPEGPPLNAQAPIALLSCFVALALAGCNRVEPIEHYQVVKEDALGRLMGDSTSEANDSKPTDRIVAAVIPRGEQAWVFRLIGPVEPVGKQLEPFKALVRSIRFESDGKPKWTLPTGWTDELQEGLRYATITIPSEGGAPLDLSVSRLPGSTEAGFDQYLLANVNRWRGQLSLPPLPPLRLHEAVEELKTDAFTASMVDLSGHKKADGMTRGPFAPAGHPGGMPPPDSPKSHAIGPSGPGPSGVGPAERTPGAASPAAPSPDAPSPNGP